MEKSIMKPVYGIGIESSCDETGVALLKDGKEILANPVYSQVDFHARYGGVVPESASRLHLEKITPLLESVFKESGISLNDLSYVAAVVRPGLVGSLLVGYYTAKALADFLEIPLIPVHHLEAHLFAAEASSLDVEFPFLGLLLSGGNSSLYKVSALREMECIGDTLDDAAGEALDKAAGLLGLKYPGGPEIEKLAKEFDEEGETKFDYLKGKNLPRNPLPKILAGQSAMTFDFSFSGIKTALYYLMQNKNEYTAKHLAWAMQERIFEIVLRNTENALKAHGLKRLVAAGGVMANRTLKKRLEKLCQKLGIRFIVPPPSLCTDNGAMAAVLGYRYHSSGTSPITETVTSSKKFS